jgi:hypothetical protein
MIVYVKLTSAGSNTGPFDLYSNLNLTTPFELDVPESTLSAGYTTYAPDNTSSIMVTSKGACTNSTTIVLYPLVTTTTTIYVVPTTTTTTIVPTTTTTTLAPTTTTTTLVPVTTTTTTTVATIVFDVKYGYLYNGYTVDDSRELANVGWNTPSHIQGDIYRDFLHFTPDWNGGSKVKEVGSTYWNAPNTGATNSAKMNFKGSGIREPGTGVFSGLTMNTYYWIKDDRSALNYNSDFNKTQHLLWDAEYIGKHPNTVFNNNYGYVVRLVKDTTILSDGESGTYTGNDGKIYRTICIGTQEWLADNLVETKYRNGDLIPEVTDNLTWAGLNSGARCSYDNDENNII